MVGIVRRPAFHSAGVADAVATPASVWQRRPEEVRRMEAQSFAVSIRLTASGSRFPAAVMFAEWRYLRSGLSSEDRTLSGRWVVTPIRAGLAVGRVCAR